MRPGGCIGCYNFLLNPPARTPAVPIPPAFSEQMQRLLGGEYPLFAASQALPPAAGLRVNTLKTEPGELLRRLGAPAEPVPWCPAGFRLAGELPGEVPPGRHPYHAAGLYYLQEPSAMAAAEILSPQPGERVLDLSAAPGGKASHLTVLMQNQGLLVANEIHPQRVWELAENLERWGVRGVLVLNETPTRLADHFGAFFDRVLLDAPCSGEGMFRKSEAARRDWSPAFVQGCAVRQAEILRQAARLVRPGGWLLYSTCTFNPTENEGVIEKFLDENRENAQWELVRPSWQAGFSSGRPEWTAGGRAELRQAVRLWPHLAPGDGHFAALLHKGEAEPGYSRPRRSRAKPQPLEPGSLGLLDEFCRENLNITFDPQRLAQAGSYLYQLPEGLPGLGSLKVLHPGWWLGTVKKGRFEPAHALALGLRCPEARLVCDLQLDSPELKRYLHGETISSPGQPGWVLVAVDGFPLGWGRRTQGVVKNHYPRGLRTM